MLRVLVLCASMTVFTTTVQAQVANSSPARAKPLAPGARPPTLQERLLLREQWVRQKEHERSQIRLGGPLVGVLLGAAALGTSAWLLTRGADGRKGGIAMAVVLGLPITTVSAVILGKRVKKRRAIWREIWAPTGS